MTNLLFTTMGYPGAGKSYFARQLAERLKIVRSNSDSMRSAMYDDPQNHTNPEGYKILFGAMDYAVSEALATGMSVIYDSKCNKRSERAKNAAIASEHGATAVTIWVQIPFEDAYTRAETREEVFGQRQLKREDIIKNNSAYLEEPEEDELLILIDGKAPFQTQYESFQDQLSKLVS